MTRLIFVFILLAFNTACTSLILEPETSFKTWTESLSANEVVELYNSATAVLSDARSTESISPFSYRDSITKIVVGTAKYPYSNSEGITSVYYKKLLIFQNSWNYSYMAPSLSITEIMSGICFGIKIVKITNESYFSPNHYSHENRLFIERNGLLEEINLDVAGVSYAFTAIKMTARKNVVIFYTTDFIRSSGPGRYLILFDLATKESKKYDY